ncbi:hypothetical protein U1Q18_050849 [Sarracenia purpurea var. burkii]
MGVTVSVSASKSNSNLGAGSIYPKKTSTVNRTELAQMYVDVATNTGLSVSILLLCFHLVAFALVDDLRNLPGKNLASFCAALLLEYTSTLVSGVLEGTACYVNEIAAYYFIMASAFWMLTMSFDVWQTLRSSATELVLSASSGAGKQRRKFVVYSLWSWLMPALLTVLVFFVLPRVFSEFDLDFQDFDRKRCSFVETDMMYVFVASVFGTILLANTFFFAASVYYIFSTQSAVARTTNNMAFFKHFQLYGRLSLIMGVTWTAEFVIYYSDFDILSVTFKIINTFEGFFIVLAFTCRKEVLHNVKSLHIAESLKDTTFRHYISLRRL